MEYSALKINELLSHKKTWRNVNAYYYIKEDNLKRLSTVIPTARHSEKETILCDTLMVDTFTIHLSKPTEGENQE